MSLDYEASRVRDDKMLEADSGGRRGNLRNDVRLGARNDIAGHD